MYFDIYTVYLPSEFVFFLLYFLIKMYLREHRDLFWHTVTSPHNHKHSAVPGYITEYGV